MKKRRSKQILSKENKSIDRTAFDERSFSSILGLSTLYNLLIKIIKFVLSFQIYVSVCYVCSLIFSFNNFDTQELIYILPAHIRPTV